MLKDVKMCFAVPLSDVTEHYSSRNLIDPKCTGESSEINKISSFQDKLRFNALSAWDLS